MNKTLQACIVTVALGIAAGACSTGALELEAAPDSPAAETAPARTDEQLLDEMLDDELVASLDDDDLGDLALEDVGLADVGLEDVDAPIASSGGDDYCGAVAAVQEISDGGDTLAPTEWRDWIDAYGPALDRAQALAPAEARDDYAEFAANFASLERASAAVDDNVMVLDMRRAIPDFDAFAAVQDRLQAMNLSACGIAYPEGGIDTDRPLWEAGSIANLLAEELVNAGLTPADAECLHDSIDWDALVEQPDVETAYGEAIEAAAPGCGIQ